MKAPRERIKRGLRWVAVQAGADVDAAAGETARTDAIQASGGGVVQECVRYRELAHQLERELAETARERDEAVTFIRVVGEEVQREGPGGDRVVVLANVRRLTSALTAAEEKVAEVERERDEARAKLENRVDLAMEIRRLEKELFPEDSELRDRAEAAEEKIAAIRAQTLEEAAAVCDEHAAFFRSDGDGSSGGASCCAAAIRARAALPHTDTETGSKP